MELYERVQNAHEVACVIERVKSRFEAPFKVSDHRVVQEFTSETGTKYDITVIDCGDPHRAKACCTELNELLKALHSNNTDYLNEWMESILDGSDPTNRESELEYCGRVDDE